jgi:hypothetical protein
LQSLFATIMGGCRTPGRRVLGSAMIAGHIGLTLDQITGARAC